MHYIDPKNSNISLTLCINWHWKPHKCAARAATPDALLVTQWQIYEPTMALFTTRGSCIQSNAQINYSDFASASLMMTIQLENCSAVLVRAFIVSQIPKSNRCARNWRVGEIVWTLVGTRVLSPINNHTIFSSCGCCYNNIIETIEIYLNWKLKREIFQFTSQMTRSSLSYTLSDGRRAKRRAELSARTQ